MIDFMQIIVQLGSTRDGLEPYQERALSHGMQCVLIDTPEYLQLRKEMGRRPFARTIPVVHPADPSEVISALQAAAISPLAIIAGFERYNYSAYEVAKQLNILPYDARHSFKPLTKIEQRQALKKHHSPIVLQPQYFLFRRPVITPRQVAHMRYPLVLKPVDGGGGLGVFVVNDYPALAEALGQINGIKNYDGGDFTGYMVEEFIQGDEHSIQGFVREGKLTILSFGKKFTFTEPAAHDASNTQIFRESGLMLIGGEFVDGHIQQFAQACLDAFGYRRGAFHIDMMRTNIGDYFLEMGFRVSGFGITALTERVSGYNWAEQTFSALLDIPSNAPRKKVKNHCVGQIRARLASEIKAAQELAKTNLKLHVEVMQSKPPKLFSERLKSDIVRHAGTIGKITAEGATIKEVEALLLQCLSERAPRRITGKDSTG